MHVVWFLLFNCMDLPVDFNNVNGPQVAGGTNLVEHLPNPYKTETSCLKHAAKGARKVPVKAGCYFACVKGIAGGTH